MQEISEAEGEKFAGSCAAAEEYPVNLVYHNTYDHILKGYSRRLDEQEDRLFFDESKANLCLRDYDDGVKCFENVTLCNNDDLRDYLSGKPVLDRVDPQCRFVFLYAPHSRERLRTTRKMLLFIFTYHQVMPTFLDFLFPFGKQLYTQDFQFSGFRSEDRLSSDDRGLELPRLGRSGRDIRMCYNLKSVEPSKSQKEWPWSIRQTAAYHSFDIETGKAFWVIIKGDQLIKRRIESTTNARRAQALNLSDFDSLATSFSSTLQAHLLIFDWCHEHWRWYINFLEQELQRLTRETLLVDLGQSSNVIDRTSSQGQRATSSQVHSSPLSVSEKATWRSGSEIKEPTSYPRPQYQAPPVPRPASLFAESQESLNADENFSFSDLQQVQSLEEKANEIILVLDSNASTLSKVKQYYRETFTFDEFPITLKSACARDFTKFEKAVGNIIGDLQMQESRTKMLLRLLTNRKSLVCLLQPHALHSDVSKLYGILDYRNMESNKLFASKAQLSTANMEIMTQGMHEIAQKTKQETVSMRIITLVTLFFLPGTFISTIMSTDIIQYQVSADGKSQEVFQLGALQLYLAITLPMMLLTFASWYGVYIWVDRKEKAKVIKMHLRALS